MSNITQLILNEEANYNEDRGPALLAGSVVAIILPVLTFTLRCHSQNLISKAKELDTWLILMGLLFSLSCAAVTIFAIENGLGKHQVRVNNEDPNPPWNTVHIFQSGYAVEILQALALMFTKLGILKFFSRVFTLHHALFRHAIYALTAYSALLGLGSTILFAAVCKPVSLYWTVAWAVNGLTAPFPVTGYCVPMPARLFVPTFLDLLSDVAILLLPLIGLWQLQIPKRKKIGLLFAFSLGAFVCVTNIIRLYYTFSTNPVGDVTWGTPDAFIWTTVQCSMGVIAGCVPAMAPLYRHFSSSRDKSGGGTSRSRGERWRLGERGQDQESVKGLNWLGSDAIGVAVTDGKATDEIPMNAIQVLSEIRTSYSKSLEAKDGSESANTVYEARSEEVAEKTIV